MPYTEEYRFILSVLNNKDMVELNPGIKAESFLNKASQEGVSPLLFKNLKEKGLLSLLPQEIREPLRNSYLATLIKNTIFMDGLDKILHALEERGVKTIVLKGAALIKHIYHDLGIRPLIDIDLLFDDGGEKEAVDVLEGLGYKIISTCPALYSNGKTAIDIHTDIDSFTRLGPLPYAPKLNVPSLWESGSPWEDGFKYVRILSPEDTVLSLSIHFFKHSFSRLIWLMDILEIIKRFPDMDWEKIGQRARESGFDRALFYVLSYSDCLSDFIPGYFLKAIAPKRTGLIEKEIMKRIIKNQRSEGYGDILYLYSIGGNLRRILYVMKLIFPPRKKIMEISGSRFPVLYYTKRVFGLLYRGVWVLWNYIAKSREASAINPPPRSFYGERL